MSDEPSPERVSSTGAPPVPGQPDADLEALPAPRRPWRRLTLLVMSLTLIGSVVMLVALRSELSFSLGGGEPRGVGELARFAPQPGDANAWVQGQGELEATDAVAYRRPLESDSYRLSRVTGAQKLFVQVRVPRDDLDPEHRRYVPPTSFVGRLVPLSQGGVRLSQLDAAVADAGRPALPSDAWLLIDGEAPATTRWTLGVGMLLLGFAAFTAFGLLRLLRPATD